MNNNQIELIKALNKSLQYDGKKVISVNPELHEVIREFHGIDFLPDDFRYKTMMNIVDSLIDYSFELSLEQLSDKRDDYISDLVDVYTGKLTSWLASDLKRLEYCDSAKIDNCSNKATMCDILSMGQYLEIDEVFSNLLSILEQME